MNTQLLPSAPPVQCYACQTPYYGPLAIAPCGCYLSLHSYCQTMLMFRKEACPHCRKVWDYPGNFAGGSSASSIMTEEPVPKTQWICTPNCSPFWVVYSLVCFVLGGVVVGVFFYFLKTTS